MNKTLKTLFLSLAFVGTFSIACFAATTDATTTDTTSTSQVSESSNTSETFVQKVLNEALNKKSIEAYNKAYSVISSISDETLKAQLLTQLQTIKTTVYTDDVKTLISRIAEFKTSGKSEALKTQLEDAIQNSKISDSDKVYLIMEVDGLNDLVSVVTKVSGDLTKVDNIITTNQLPIKNDTEVISEINKHISEAWKLVDNKYGSEFDQKITDIKNLYENLKDPEKREAVKKELASLDVSRRANIESFAKAAQASVDTFNKADATVKFDQTIGTVAKQTTAGLIDAADATKAALKEFENADTTVAFKTQLAQIEANTTLSDVEKLLAAKTAYDTFKTQASTVKFDTTINTVAKQTAVGLEKAKSVIDEFKNAQSTQTFKTQVAQIVSAAKTNIKNENKQIISLINALKKPSTTKA
jgi:hypothetical protein